ncbi:MAG: lysophospholipid acyltransferase family protein [Myxococcota bacterium]|nr:lysophospholipid acyltransferase family protein [Myxococcota bacterium]
MRALAWILARTPLHLAERFTWLLAWVWWLVLPVRKRVAVDNLRKALPGVPVGPTLRAALASLALGIVELLQIDRIEVEATGLDALRARSLMGLGSIVVGGHAAGFEAAVGTLAEDIPSAVFVRPPRNATARAILEEHRGVFELLPPHGSMAQGYDALERGKVLIWVHDQRRNEGIPVPFFGRPAWTSPGPAAAHKRTGIPVFGGWISREAPGKLRVRLEPIEMSGDVERDTATLTAWIEARVREDPGAWLWLHDRWKVP